MLEEKIKNIVCVMLENRSFDCMLGWLYDGKKTPNGKSFEGLEPNLSNSLNIVGPNGEMSTREIKVRRNSGLVNSDGSVERTSENLRKFSIPNADPKEGYENVNFQLFGTSAIDTLSTPKPNNEGFVNSFKEATIEENSLSVNPEEIMTAYTPEQLPVLSTLAKEYAVCDNWFCSVPTQTFPNRAFMHAATSDGTLSNLHLIKSETIYNRIQKAIEGGREDLSWKVYHTDFIPLTRLLMTQLHSLSLNKNFAQLDEFYKDCSEGKLSSYTFLDCSILAKYNNSQHPPNDVRPGESFLADVYNSLVNSPHWKDTLLVITYDEHGGCYDHIPPPSATPPVEGQVGEFGFRFDRFGVRVPTVLVSPYIEKGTICRPVGDIPFDHTSVISTVRKTFGLKEPLTQRDANAPTLEVALTLDTPRTDKVNLRPLPYDKSDAHNKSFSLLENIGYALEQISGKTLSRKEERIYSNIVREYNNIFHNKNNKFCDGITKLKDHIKNIFHNHK